MQDGHPNQKIKVPISPQTGSLDTNPACVPDRFKRGDTMGRKIPQLLVVAYANAFAEEPRLKEVSEMRSFVFPRVPQTTELSPKPQKCGLALVSVGVFKTAPRWGFSFLLDATGNLFKPKKKLSLRDVEANTEAIAAVMRVSRGVGRFSGIILQHALLRFYTEYKLFPVGLCAEMECIDTWALRQGSTLQRLVT